MFIHVAERHAEGTRMLNWIQMGSAHQMPGITAVKRGRGNKVQKHLGLSFSSWPLNISSLYFY